jgi:hypothetical protein
MRNMQLTCRRVVSQEIESKFILWKWESVEKRHAKDALVELQRDGYVSYSEHRVVESIVRRISRHKRARFPRCRFPRPMNSSGKNVPDDEKKIINFSKK